MRQLWVIFVTSLLFAACTTDPNSVDCSSDGECSGESVCVASRCVPRPGDVTITSFVGPSDPVRAGEMATLSWSLQFANTATISADGQVIHTINALELGNGTLDVVVEADTVFTLSATDGLSTVTADATVLVRSDVATIVRFDATPSSINLGGRSVLRWETENAATGRILDDANQLIVDIDPENLAAGQLEVSPNASKRYKLAIANPTSDDVVEITVQVLDALPKIQTFAALKQGLIRGEDTRLVWEVSNADNVTITAGDVEVTQSSDDAGFVLVSPSATTRYELTATNAAGTTSQFADIDVFEPLTITSFDATPSDVAPGGSTVLTWVVSGQPTNFGIRDSQGNIVDVAGQSAGSGSVEVFPNQTTSYILTVSNPVESANSAVLVSLLPLAPSITSFTATPSTVAEGSTTRLAWAISGATSVTIADDTGAQVSLGGASPVSDVRDIVVTADRTFTLTATNSGGQATRTVDVTAVPPVQLVSFDADANQIAAGEPVRLTWVTSGTSDLTLVANVVNVDVSGLNRDSDFIDLNPTQSTSYTLTAVGLPSPLQATANVTVLTPVAVQTLTATPTTIGQGAQTTVAWTTVGATSASLECTDTLTSVSTPIDITSLSPTSGNVTITLNATAICTLTAVGFRGPATRSTTVTVLPTLPQIADFSGDQDVIALGQSLTLSWQTTNTTTLELTDDQNNTIDVSTLNVASDSITLSPARSTTFTLKAINANADTTLQVSVIVVDTASLLINEVFYDALIADDGLEYIELYNAGDTFIDLQYFSLGAGGSSYDALTDLSGVLPPRSCFVVGGPTSSAENNNATFDLPLQFSPALQNGGTAADGVALFFQPASSITTMSVPIDSILYEGTNSSLLLAEDGLPDTEISPAAFGASIKRAGLSDVLVVGPMDAGLCQHVDSITPTQAMNQAVGTLTVFGWGLTNALDDVFLGSQQLTCIDSSVGLECDVTTSAQFGAVDLVVVHARAYADDGNGVAVVVPVTPRSLTLPNAYTYENEIADPGVDFWCGVTTTNTTVTAGTSVVASAEVFVAGSTDTTGQLPVGMTVEAVMGTVGDVRGTFDPTLVLGTMAGVVGNNVEVQATLDQSIPASYELAFRVTTDGVNYIWCDSLANLGSDDGYSAGPTINWQ